MNGMAMSSPAMASPVTSALMAVLMMEAMMLPAAVPALARYHWAARSIRRTIQFTVGYAFVYAAVALVLLAVGDTWHPGAFTAGLLLLVAGIAQQSAWKARRLARCAAPCATERPYRDGLRLGVDCAASCAPLMALLVVAGPMSALAMGASTVAIAAERLVVRGATVARITGALTVTFAVLALG